MVVCNVGWFFRRLVGWLGGLWSVCWLVGKWVIVFGLVVLLLGGMVSRCIGRKVG